MRTGRFAENRFLQALVVWLCAFWILTAIAPINRFDWLLENLLVIAYAVGFIATYRAFTFSNTSYALLTLFLTLHLIGAHYTYAQTPLGHWLREWFALERNPYDRIVHFAYGLLWAYPFREVLVRIGGVREGWACALAITIVLAFSAFFEILEAWIAMWVSPELGDTYLGTQGDTWDAQRDMFLALSGAVVATAITRRVRRSRTAPHAA